jgi:hypothetical protein
MICALALVLLGLPDAARAQEAPSDVDAAPPRPLELLLEQRASLRLTTEQLDGLEGIRARLAAQNEPLVNQMLALRKEWQQQRGQRGRRGEAAARLERIRADAEPIRAQIQQNNRTAMQAVNRLLTRNQRAQLRGIVEERRKRDAARPPAVRRPGRAAAN